MIIGLTQSMLAHKRRQGKLQKMYVYIMKHRKLKKPKQMIEEKRAIAFYNDNVLNWRLK